MAAAHHDRRPILASDRKDAIGGRGGFEPVAERRHLKHSRSGAELAAGACGDMDAIVGAIAVDPGALVVPLVRDDPGRDRMPAARDHRMARAGFGHALRMKTVRIDDALRQPGEPILKFAAARAEQIGRELVDRNQDHQLRCAGLFLGGGGRRRKCCQSDGAGRNSDPFLGHANPPGRDAGPSQSTARRLPSF